jgi:hypothetical protein
VLDVPVSAAHDGGRPRRALPAVPWAAWVPTSPGASCAAPRQPPRLGDGLCRGFPTAAGPAGSSRKCDRKLSR